MVADGAPRPHIGEGPHGGVASHGAVIELGGIHGGALADPAVPEHGVGTDLAVPVHGGVSPQDGPRQQGDAGSHGAPGVHIGGGGVHHGDPVFRQPPQDQLPGVRHGRRQRRRRVKGPEGRGQGLRPPQGADACRLRRAVGQRGPSPQPGQQHLAVGGIHAASVLRAVYRHHRPGDHYHVPAGGGKGRLRMVKKRHVTARQVVQDLLAAVLRADNKIPLHAAVHKLLRRPGQHRAEQNRLQHQRLILGGQSTLQVKNRNFTIHGNHPPFYNPSHYIMLCVKIQYFCVFFWQ